MLAAAQYFIVEFCLYPSSCTGGPSISPKKAPQDNLLCLVLGQPARQHEIFKKVLEGSLAISHAANCFCPEDGGSGERETAGRNGYELLVSPALKADSALSNFLTPLGCFLSAPRPWLRWPARPCHLLHPVSGERGWCPAIPTDVLAH